MISESGSEYIPQGIAVIEHGKGTGVREIQKDQNFGKEVGGTREVECTLDPNKAIQWHVHPKMNETFTAVDGELSILIITGANKNGPEIQTRHLFLGQSLLVEKDTPHLVFNKSEGSITATATQQIVEVGGNTVNFDLI